jgi:hypothetical protein
MEKNTPGAHNNQDPSDKSAADIPFHYSSPSSFGFTKVNQQARCHLD